MSSTFERETRPSSHASPLNPRCCTVNTHSTRVDVAGSPLEFYETVYKIIAHPLIWLASTFRQSSIRPRRIENVGAMHRCNLPRRAEEKKKEKKEKEKKGEKGNVNARSRAPNGGRSGTRKKFNRAE